MKNSPQKGLNILRLHKVMRSNLLSTRRTNFAEFSVLSFCYKTNNDIYVAFPRTLNVYTTHQDVLFGGSGLVLMLIYHSLWFGFDGDGYPQKLIASK